MNYGGCTFLRASQNLLYFGRAHELRRESLGREASVSRRLVSRRRELSRWRNIACLYNGAFAHCEKKRLRWSKTAAFSLSLSFLCRAAPGEKELSCPSYFSRDFSQRANERSEFLFILSSPSFPFVIHFSPAFTFFDVNGKIG